MTSLEVEVPNDLVALLGEAEVRAIAQEAFIVRLYELGRIGSGQGAEILNTTRRQFLEDVTARYGVSSFDDNVDLAAEAARG